MPAITRSSRGTSQHHHAYLCSKQSFLPQHLLQQWEHRFTAGFILVTWLLTSLQVLILPTVEGDSRSADDAQGGVDRPHHQSRGAAWPLTGQNLLPAGAIPA